MEDEINSEVTSEPNTSGSDARSLRSRLVARVTPGFVRRRYAVKFTLSIMVILVVVAGAGAVTYVDAREMAREEASAQVESTVTLQADSLSRWMEGMRTQTRTVSASESLATGNRTQMRERLFAAQRRSSNGVQAMYLVDAERGEVIASTKTTVEGWSLDRVEMPWSNESVVSSFSNESDVWTSKAYVSKTTTYTDEDSPWYTDDHKFMAVASPVAGHENVYLVVAGGIDDRVAQLHQPAINQTTWIVTTGGETVLETDAKNVSSAGLLADRGTDLSTAGAGDDSVALLERGDYVLAYAPINGTDWVAVTAIPKSEAFALSGAVGRNIGILVGASLLSLLVVGVVLGRRTVRPLSDLRERSRRMERGELDVALDTHREDEFGRLYRAFESMRDELRDQIETSEELNRHLERKADEYRDVMETCADGDLTRRMDAESDNEAMAAIGEAFNAMVADIEATMARLSAFADDVADASEVVTASSEEVYAASEQVTASIQQISAGADSQHAQFRTVTDELSGLSATTEEIAASSNQVADLAEETAKAGREGREAAREAIRGLDEIETTSEEAVAEIERLEAEMAEVDELVEFIREIATQTNMLALNASIEVSRSSTGDGNPEGFAAVANKIKDLAEEAKVAAEDVEERLDRIKAQTDRTGEGVQSASDQITQHADSIQRAIESLEAVADYVQETNTGVQNISDATEEQAQATEEVVAMFDDVAAISERTADEAQTVASAAEEQTSALTEVSRSASDMTVQADQLREALGRFETEVDPDGSLGEDAGVGGELVDGEAVGVESEVVEADVLDEDGEVVDGDDGEDSDVAEIDDENEADADSSEEDGKPVESAD